MQINMLHTIKQIKTHIIWLFYKYGKKMNNLQ
jgi:hypothetical protein